jgi:hypothetical protein
LARAPRRLPGHHVRSGHRLARNDRRQPSPVTQPIEIRVPQADIRQPGPSANVDRTSAFAILEIRQNPHRVHDPSHVFFLESAFRSARYDSPVGAVIAGQPEVIQKRLYRSRLGVLQVGHIEPIRIESIACPARKGSSDVTRPMDSVESTE